MLMPYVTSHDVEIAYEVRGEGTPIVLLMGLGLPGMVWNQLADRLLEHDFQVIIPDNRGTGHSQAPLPPYRMGEMADDVIAVMDDAGVDSAIVMGVSFGGMLAQHVALNHPDRVDGLMLCSTTAGIPTGHFPRMEAIGLLLKMVFAGTTVTIDEAQRLFAHPESRGRLKDLLGRWEEILGELPTAPWAIVGQLLAASFHHTGPRLGQIAIPTRVVTGDSDFLIPPRNSVILAEHITGATLSVIPQAGHIVIHEHPERLLNLVLQLRREVEGRDTNERATTRQMDRTGTA